MSVQEETAGSGLLAEQPYLTGVVAGVVSAILTGLVIYFGFDRAIIGEHIPEAVGLTGDAVGWATLLIIGAVLGLVYAGLANVGALDAYLSTASSAGITGLVYGIVLWVIAIVVVPFLMGDGVGGIGEYAVTVEGILGFALLGSIIGVVYVLLPALTGR